MKVYSLSHETWGTFHFVDNCEEATDGVGKMTVWFESLQGSILYMSKSGLAFPHKKQNQMARPAARVIWYNLLADGFEVAPPNISAEISERLSCWNKDGEDFFNKVLTLGQKVFKQGDKYYDNYAINA